MVKFMTDRLAYRIYKVLIDYCGVDDGEQSIVSFVSSLVGGVQRYKLGGLCGGLGVLYNSGTQLRIAVEGVDRTPEIADMVEVTSHRITCVYKEEMKKFSKRAKILQQNAVD